MIQEIIRSYKISSQRGRSRKQVTAIAVRRSRKQFPSISKDTTRAFNNTCNKFGTYHKERPAEILDQYGYVIGFTSFSTDVILGTFFKSEPKIKKVIKTVGGRTYVKIYKRS